MPELIDHKVDGFICKSKDAEGLLEGINYYLDNQSLIGEHGDNAFNSLLKLGITYDNFKKQWLSIYH